MVIQEITWLLSGPPDQSIRHKPPGTLSLHRECQDQRNTSQFPSRSRQYLTPTGGKPASSQSLMWPEITFAWFWNLYKQDNLVTSCFCWIWTPEGHRCSQWVSTFNSNGEAQTFFYFNVPGHFIHLSFKPRSLRWECYLWWPALKSVLQEGLYDELCSTDVLWVLEPSTSSDGLAWGTQTHPNFHLPSNVAVTNALSFQFVLG